MDGLETDSARDRRALSSAQPADASALLRRDAARGRIAGPIMLALVLLVGAGALLGYLAYRVSSAGSGWPVKIVRTADGWLVSSPQHLHESRPALTDDYLTWLNGDCLELFDLRNGKARVLEPPPSDGSGGYPAVLSDRYAAWMANSAKFTQDEIHAYDLKRRRRFTVAGVENLDGTIALAHTVLFWQSHETTAAASYVPLIRARDLVSGRSFTIGAGDVQLVDAAGALVVWFEAHGKSDSRQVTVVEDVVSGHTWRLRLCPRKDDLAGCSLCGRTLVWQLVPHSTKPAPVRYAWIEALDLDSGARRTVAQGPHVWLVAARDGRVLWLNGASCTIESASGADARPLPAAERYTAEPPVISAAMIAGELGSHPLQIEVRRIAP